MTSAKRVCRSVWAALSARSASASVPASSSAEWYWLASWLAPAFQCNPKSGTLASAAAVAAAGHTCISSLLHLLQVRFDDVHGFEFTDEVAIFDLLDVSLVHGWLVDTQVSLTYDGRAFSDLFSANGAKQLLH